MTFPFTTDFDFGCPTLAEAIEFCQGLHIVSSLANGPAGGNPNVTIEFRNKFELYGFIHELYEGQDEHIQEAYEARGFNR